MSEYRTVIDKIKTILGMDEIKEVEVEVELETAETETDTEVVETTEVTMAEATLEDGSVIYYDGALAVETAIFTDEALETPIADGTFILENGDTFVTAGGIITEYTPIVEEETEEAPEPEVEEELEVEPVKENFEELYNEIKVVVEELKSKLEKFEAQEVELKSEIQKLSAEPEVESISQEPQDKRELTDLEKRLNTLEAIRKMRQK